MNKFKFTLNKAGVRELMKSREMEEITKGFADDIQRNAGEGYEITHSVGYSRNTFTVSAETIQAKRDNLDNNTLEKALGAARR